MNKAIMAWWLLRITYGLYWGIIGIDKFFGFATESQNRVSNITLSLLPLSIDKLLQLIGVLEIIIALLILTKWPRLGAVLGVMLMTFIVINLIAMGTHYDIAIHGTTIALGMVGFILLSDFLKK